MEQGQPAGANRGSPDDSGQARDEASRKAALRAMDSPAGASHSSMEDSSERREPGGLEATTHYRFGPHEASFDAPTSAGVRRSMPVDVADFAQRVVNQGIDTAFDQIDVLRDGGMTLEAIYLDLLGPTAQLLGRLWEEDRCDFTEVTIGLGRLHQILRELGPQFRSEIECVNLGCDSAVTPVDSPEHCKARRVLLVPAVAGQHTFGLQMLADFFARAGWDVWGGTVGSDDGLCRLLKDEWFDVVGLAAGCERDRDMMAASIRAIREASRNRAVCVMVGGPVLSAHPDFAVAVGADATAMDAPQALREAGRLLARKDSSS